MRRPRESENCNDNCTLSFCGDGIINESANEECDEEGESNFCDTNCTFTKCGDGVTNTLAGEECDDGVEGVPTDSTLCNADCTLLLRRRLRQCYRRRGVR